MRTLRSFAKFWYDFIIGDDWRVALSVGAAMAATYAVNQLTGATSWLIVTVTVLIALPASIYRVARRNNRGASPASH
ncbi:hypothetical protein [Mycolicibacterium arenosum]|uniref:Uncharacterized protein n=1 Tax=Mycolicibacterium arenosum TaxID=2952157 RepID=A0ABT1MBC9_9MYCO|nr:hypothetical protein [Mycolicibacterium sp. CAU 1645]MCP9276460.1 hypothetical protein [Mycolicibacterium sp. CAU 1645]